MTIVLERIPTANQNEFYYRVFDNVQPQNKLNLNERQLTTLLQNIASELGFACAKIRSFKSDKTMREEQQQ